LKTDTLLAGIGRFTLVYTGIFYSAYLLKPGFLATLFKSGLQVLPEMLFRGRAEGTACHFAQSTGNPTGFWVEPF